jgi:ribosomal protein S18 acetylase RimI-like enzyme
MSGRAMTGNGWTGDPWAASGGPALYRDAKTLEVTMREAIGTSPDSFLATLVDVASKKVNDWINEIQSSTWVVAEQDGKGVGVAAGKSPERGKDIESPWDSRYIESVWITPSLRRQRLGERLITYLMAAECRKNLNIKQFLLWVFEANSPAISLYEHMKFDKTAERHEGCRPEIKYRLDVNPGNYAEICRIADEALADKEKYGVTYRVLGEGDSA